MINRYGVQGCSSCRLPARPLALPATGPTSLTSARPTRARYWGSPTRSLSMPLIVCLPACLPVCLSACLSLPPIVCLSVERHAEERCRVQVATLPGIFANLVAGWQLQTNDGDYTPVFATAIVINVLAFLVYAVWARGEVIFS